MSADDKFTLETILTQEHAKNAPKLKADKFFEIFAAQQVLKVRGFDLDPEQIRSGVLGGGNDGGVDAFYVFVNRKLIREDTPTDAFKGQQLNIELVIIQATRAGGFAESALQKLQDFTEQCLGLTANLAAAPTTLYSQSLLEVVDRFRETYKAGILQKPALTITYSYVTLGDQVDPKVEVRRDILLKKAKDCYSVAKVDFDFVGANKLMKWYYKAPERTLKLECSRTLAWSQFGPGYVGLVPLRKFFEFLTDSSGALREHIFEANVRDYQGDVTVNQEIRRTLALMSEEEFWWLNNGVTIIATDITANVDILTVTDPLVVNGLQTSYEIYHRFADGDGLFDDSRTVLVRLIKNSNPQSVDRIIKATNSQTKIPRVWLHATEDIHRRIETVLKSHDLYYDRRKNYHLNQGVPVTKIVTLPFLAQTLAAIVLQRPDDARARPTTVIERHYQALFGRDVQMDVYAKCAIVGKAIEDYLDGYEITRGDRLNVLFYMAMVAVCSITNSAEPRKAQIASLDTGKINDVLLKECLAIVWTPYRELGRNDRVAKSGQLLEAVRSQMKKRFQRKRARKTKTS